MKLDYCGAEPEPIGYLLVDGFSMMAFVAATEPLRVANRIAERELFRWLVITENGAPATASNGMRLLPDHAATDLAQLPSLAICSGFLDSPSREQSQSQGFGPSQRLRAWLHGLDKRGCTLGGIDTGCFWLAEAGLLDGQTVTLHWESLPTFRERFAAVTAVESLYEIGERRFSCAGGAAATDMTLELIARRSGHGLATAVAEQLLHARLRGPDTAQRQPLPRRLNTHNQAVVQAVALMETHIETPLSASEIAARVGLSLRQLQRLFEADLSSTPADWYRNLRLARARQLLIETDTAIVSVGAACGFTSAAAFSRAYRRHFNCSPVEQRRQMRVHTSGDAQPGPAS